MCGAMDSGARTRRHAVVSPSRCARPGTEGEGELRHKSGGNYTVHTTIEEGLAPFSYAWNGSRRGKQTRTGSCFRFVLVDGISPQDRGSLFAYLDAVRVQRAAEPSPA